MLILCLSNITFSYAQNLSLDETKQILLKHKWLLKRFERNDKMIAVQEEYKGLKMVFKENGYVYSFTPKDDEILNSTSETSKWNISASKFTFETNGKKMDYNYKLEDFGGYKLYLTQVDLENAATSVYEISDKIENDDLTFYSFVDSKEKLAGAEKLTKEKSTTISKTNKESKENIIKQLNEFAKEAEGNIKYWSKNSKQKIEKSSLIQTENGIKIETVISEVDEPLTTYTYEFNPIDIAEMTISELPDESPVGHLKLKFLTNSSFSTSYDKKAGLAKAYKDFANLNYLKVDSENLEKIKALFNKLTTIYTDEEDENALFELTELMEFRKFWFSVNGASKTYTLENIDIINCSFRVSYYLESISTENDTKQYYMTQIPLKNIKELLLDKSKSKPNCIMLEANSNGFETFYLKGDYYVPANSVAQIPLFINVSNEVDKAKTVELVNRLVKNCGGKTLKLN